MGGEGDEVKTEETFAETVEAVIFVEFCMPVQKKKKNWKTVNSDF